MVEELVALPYIVGDEESSKRNILNYLNDHNLTLQEIYNWLINNQNNSNAIVLLGDFNNSGIGTSIDKQKAFELYQKAANLENAIGINSLGYCYQYGIGTRINKQKAFELYQKAANLGNAIGIKSLGYCYQYGIGTIVDKQKAFVLYQKAADLGNSFGIKNLADYCYRIGIGISIDKQKTFELYQKAADLGNSSGIYSLGYCYENGIGASIDKQKAYELYQKAANLGNTNEEPIFWSDALESRLCELYMSNDVVDIFWGQPIEEHQEHLACSTIWHIYVITCGFHNSYQMVTIDNQVIHFIAEEEKMVSFDDPLPSSIEIPQDLKKNFDEALDNEL
ncbi:hypothetical protein C1645_722869, partial [Glomus cerebriforme]